MVPNTGLEKHYLHDVQRLVPGSMVLGKISQINRYDMALALPNNLTGYIPITSISDNLTEVLKKLAIDDEADDNIEDTKQLDLKSYFTIGQYLRAYVISTQDEIVSGGKGKRHIELSINPYQVNKGLKKADVIVNCMVQASVSSVEDHGLIMNLGLEDKSVRGFMSSQEVEKNTDFSKIEDGSVYLCLVTGISSNGNIIKLTSDSRKAGNIKKSHFLANAPSMDCFQPGTAVEFLVTGVTSLGIVGKLMGMLDVTADLIHSGATAVGVDIEEKYKAGKKLKARIICTFPTVEEKKFGISLLDHVVSLTSITAKSTTGAVAITEALPISTILEEARVVQVKHGVGLFVDVGVKGVQGFVHISKVADGKIETLSESTGPYQLGSVHKARIIGYNSVDGLFIVSLEQKVLNQQFLRIEDVKVGQVVQGSIEKLIINESGINSILVNIGEGITGLVPEIHFADVHLEHPERKFKQGSTVKARVLSTFPEKRQLRLTLKKTLVNSDAEIWDSYDNLMPGLQTPGTLLNILSSGAVVQFYGGVRGFLPVSEMSESYIQDPRQHFHVGQVVNTHIVSVDASERRMIVSCKDPLVFGSAQREAFEALELGAIVDGTISEKTSNEFVVELNKSCLKALLPFEHLTDGSSSRCLSQAKKIRINQTLKEILVLNKQDLKHLIKVTIKPSLVKAAEDGRFLTSFGNVVEGAEVDGYVQNITPIGVFVQFGGDLTGLLLKSHMPDEAIQLPDFGMLRNQSLTSKILSVDYVRQRFLLTLKPILDKSFTAKNEVENSSLPSAVLSNPVDENSTSINDFTFGKLTKAKIISIKQTQMNMQLADGVQGRIDISGAFDAWEDVKDRKRPFSAFHPKEVLAVRILGMHDSRNHRFLPITNRGKAPVFELSSKPSDLKDSELEILTIDKVEVGSVRMVFVNNISDDCIWVNLTPNVRGRIRAMDVSDDISLLNDLTKNFPIGSALKARVTKVDVANNRLDLSARSGSSSDPLTLEEISKGMVMPGIVTKVAERQIMVQLSENLSGPVHLMDLADDYSKADPNSYQKNQIVRVCVKDVDVTKNRISLSVRPSRVLSSSLPVEDPEINSISQLKINDIIRGFVKNIDGSGLFISLSSTLTAFVRVSDLSDLFLKEWKSDFEIGQLVKGKVIALDSSQNHVQMSLKQSHVDKDYKAPLSFADMEVGKVVTGKVRKVEDFGVFVVVDGSMNVSGLCHRSEMADARAPNPKNLFTEGDAVQAKILKIDQTKKQISFGLKASYFGAQSEGGQQLTMGSDIYENSNGEAQRIDATKNFDRVNLGLKGEDNEIAKDEGMAIEKAQEPSSDSDMDGSDDNGVSIKDNRTILDASGGLPALNAGGFDWSGGQVSLKEMYLQPEVDAEDSQLKKKKRRKAEIKIDRTGDLDANGPQSIADFERLLMGQPNSSVLWVSYMAFQLQMGEAIKAREVAERAIRTINIREDVEKLNIWVALLNLENTYGTDESLDEVFQRACEYNDSQEIHERLISIYIQSGKNEVSPILPSNTLKPAFELTPHVESG